MSQETRREGIPNSNVIQLGQKFHPFFERDANIGLMPHSPSSSEEMFRYGAENRFTLQIQELGEVPLHIFAYGIKELGEPGLMDFYFRYTEVLTPLGSEGYRITREDLESFESRAKKLTQFRDIDQTVETGKSTSPLWFITSIEGENFWQKVKSNPVFEDTLRKLRLQVAIENGGLYESKLTIAENGYGDGIPVGSFDRFYPSEGGELPVGKFEHKGRTYHAESDFYLLLPASEQVLRKISMRIGLPHEGLLVDFKNLTERQLYIHIYGETSVC